MGLCKRQRIREMDKSIAEMQATTTTETPARTSPLRSLPQNPKQQSLFTGGGICLLQN